MDARTDYKVGWEGRFFVLQGGADEIGDASATSCFFGNLGSTEKTLKIDDGFYHEALNELGGRSSQRDRRLALSRNLAYVGSM